MAFRPPKKPLSLLGYHRILSPTAGVRVSPLCLGAMNFGTAWQQFMGECSKETAFGMLDYFYEQGGNFIDTANNYQAGESESWLGEWMQKRNNRDDIVLATKFTIGFRPQDAPEKLQSNFQGNHSKSLRLSVEHSLKKLQTTYVDLLYVHWWDFSTSIPELMNGLHNMIVNGKVLYLGISDCPAWIVVKCNEYARHHGLTQFSVYQGLWNAAVRDFERDIIPMCEAEGMGLAPWGALGRGMFKLAEEYDDPEREGRKMGPEQDPKYRRVAKVLNEIAKKKNTVITSIALAYVMHKTPYVFPIVGGRKIEHLEGNVEALSIQLTPEEIEEVEAAEPFDAGFPLGFLFEFGGTKYNLRNTTQDIYLVSSNAAITSVPKLLPIQPANVAKRFEAS
ncbi:hypothetical protein BAUCODRAFT_122290 [Baudoinia panamericana UAMH 10762]|uniref:NADP-dependent oxidoreductase domain-containing protein n=1 Tax=Baudoinia panamericana (strain UAMH 10762) TaxID=717646 RepID=M2NBI9_BAUPA|nr:uncharacterized protein BAUCODRAFT_122290 [Baudoinia panamericana UAMH 10762]EMC96270.1 hypothetical protein BAUCODRAFT_122290 [Baudoinia panamericana UAMH 10762]